MKKESVLTENLDYCAIFRSAPDSYLLLSPTLMILEASDAYIKSTMLTREKVIGHGLFEIFPDVIQDELNPGAKNLRASLERVLKNKIPDAMAVQRYDIRSSNAIDDKFEERYWSPVNSPVLDENGEVQYIIHRVDDVTSYVKSEGILALGTKVQPHEKIQFEIIRRAQELQAVNERLRQSEERLRLLTEGAKDCALFVLDTNGFVTTCNGGAGKINGYAYNEIVGKHFSILYSKNDIEMNHPRFELDMALAQGRYEEEGWRVRKDGSQFWANVIITPVYNEKNVLIGFCKISRDLTERKLYEDELRSAKEKAEKASLTKSSFLASMSHELRTPLNSIIGFTGILLMGLPGALTTDQNKHLKIVQHSAKHLLAMINDLLDIAKIEANKVNLNTESFFITEIISEVLASLKSQADEKSLLLINNTPDTKVLINTDKRILSQILINVVTNAIKYTEKGGVYITVGECIENNKSFIAINVKDTGIGISPESTDTIFNAFERTDAVKKIEGTGLGLYLSQKLAGFLQGMIKFESELHVGSSFTILLPKESVF
ncbi:MAG: PAS domain S-box protein [Gammaproteobacteria bacterium]|nr:PAS domain S-box protein [Gammaproteobacteria bacterium]